MTVVAVVALLKTIENPIATIAEDCDSDVERKPRWRDVGVEYNIEGDLRPGLVKLVERVRPDQCTLVPVRPGEVTSEAGWPPGTPKAPLREIIERFHQVGVRVSVFVDPEPAPIEWAAELGADRVELYTEPYARAFEQGAGALETALERYEAACRHAHELGLGINAGHDLDLENLATFVRVPHID